MYYILAEEEWMDELIYDPPSEHEDDIIKEEQDPLTGLGRLLPHADTYEGHSELFHPSEPHRPTLFDTQLGAVAMAAEKVWEEITPLIGMVMVKHLQLEKIAVDSYDKHDPSQIDTGEVVFVFEVEATVPQYRRGKVAIHVPFRGGKPQSSLTFRGPDGKQYLLRPETIAEYLNVDPYFRMSRPSSVPLSQIDRLESNDYPDSPRPETSWATSVGRY